MKKIKEHYRKIKFYLKTFLSEPVNKVLLIIFFGLALTVYIIYLIEVNKNPEIKNFFDSIWWFFITVTTVGYGDIVPKTVIGKVISIVIILIGVVLVSILSGTVASILVELRLKERKGLGKVNFSGHVSILGWNQHLEKVIKSLENFAGKNFNVVIINDMTETEFEELKYKFIDIKLKFIKGDFTKENVLKRANIKSCKYVLLLADTYNDKSMDKCDEKTLLSIINIRALNSNAKIYAEVVKEEKAKVVLNAGADDIVINGELNHVFLGSLIYSPSYPILFKELLNSKIKIESIPKNFIGEEFKSLFEFFKEKHGKLVIGILRTKKGLTIDDLLSNDNAIDRFIKNKFEEADENFFEDTKEEYDVAINLKDDYIITKKDTSCFVIE